MPDNPYSTDSTFNYGRAMRKMDEAKVEAIVGATFTNSYYVSGVRTLFNEWAFSEPWEAAIVPRDATIKPTLITLTAVLPALVGGQPTWMPNICLYDWLSMDKSVEPVDEGSPLGGAIQSFVDERVTGDLENDIGAATVKALQRLGLTRGPIGFDDLRFGRYIQQHLPGIEVVDAHQLFWEIRKVRTPTEIRLCSYAARANQAALDAVIKAMRPGVNWRDLAYLYKDGWTRHGGRSVSDKGLFWGGKFRNEYIPDTFFMPDNDFTIEAGKYYVLEGEGHVLGYHADCSRTVFVGDPPADYLRGVDAVMHAYEAIERELIPGRSSKGVYKAGIGAMKDQGVPYPEKTIVLSHGVGLEFVEWYTDFPTQR
ncbi:MAG: M24 family metallopeptidase, partial [Gammaproteobacteria bacterium]